MKYLLVVAHPDDEVLGAGASIYKWTRQGHSVDIAILFSEPSNMYRKYFKRLLDIVLAALAIVILLPVLAVVALFVLIFMGKPVLFKQARIGKDGKTFHLYKFRSMTNKKDKDGNLMPEAQRLTRAGLFLRNSSLDELPELWSILKGEMSFVGPRPMPVFYDPYFLPEERHRHSVRGGLIPPDSLSGKTVTSYEEQFHYECMYADNISLWMDVKVILTTFKILFNRVKTDYGTCERPHLNIYRKDLVLK